MSKRVFMVSLGILVTVALAMIMTAIRFRPEPAWDVSYEMANSQIEWSGAGYSGIYGR